MHYLRSARLNPEASAAKERPDSQERIGLDIIEADGEAERTAGLCLDDPA